jgi:hypothetical protein
MLWGWAGAALLLGARLAARAAWEALLASLGPAATPKAAP